MRQPAPKCSRISHNPLASAMGAMSPKFPKATFRSLAPNLRLVKESRIPENQTSNTAIFLILYMAKL